MKLLYWIVGVNIYISMALLVYTIANHYWPYKQTDDLFGDIDSNKVLAFIWPITIIAFTISLPFVGISKAFDMIRDAQKKELERKKLSEDTEETPTEYDERCDPAYKPSGINLATRFSNYYAAETFEKIMSLEADKPEENQDNTSDAIVRCKDCAYYHSLINTKHNERVRWCSHHYVDGFHLTPDYFCPCGERKRNNE